MCSPVNVAIVSSAKTLSGSAIATVSVWLMQATGMSWYWTAMSRGTSVFRLGSSLIRERLMGGIPSPWLTAARRSSSFTNPRLTRISWRLPPFVRWTASTSFSWSGVTRLRWSNASIMRSFRVAMGVRASRGRRRGCPTCSASRSLPRCPTACSRTSGPRTSSSVRYPRSPSRWRGPPSPATGRYGNPYWAVKASATSSSVTMPSLMSTWPIRPPCSFWWSSASSSFLRVMSPRSRSTSPIRFVMIRFAMCAGKTYVKSFLTVHQAHEVVGVAGPPQRVLEGDDPLRVELVERLIHRPHALFLSGLDDRVNLVDLLLPDERTDGVIHKQEFGRQHAAAARRLRGGGGQRRRAQVAGFRDDEGGLDGFEVAHLTDENNVGVLATLHTSD